MYTHSVALHLARTLTARSMSSLPASAIFVTVAFVKRRGIEFANTENPLFRETTSGIKIPDHADI
jgi:hypothetical protein